ncbi:hypothetical protein IGI04_007643 [Brassica rapa subsp. trilocularis]|uniref:Uncharacterized protein n=1 Tax=Brassica rapa subsp. trilocularis TaxID=1813537 RepID=A0ABQ7NIS5_BRACM|nr:hypothetical protein IGI04_007083 [Brassica rapa subsp. trilocularis]KAG5411324.1 hypothetical protein IGI04_007643 [Brassica rapa subsp. trilocularis]
MVKIKGSRLLPESEILRKGKDDYNAIIIRRGFCINLEKPGLYHGNHEEEQWWFCDFFYAQYITVSITGKCSHNQHKKGNMDSLSAPSASEERIYNTTNVKDKFL